jgi:hypothetical protein
MLYANLIIIGERVIRLAITAKFSEEFKEIL